VNGERLASRYSPFGIMAIGTDSGSRRAAMLEARLLMHVVARDARGKFRPIERHIAHVSENVPVSRIQAFVIRF
jgi:hypothetical protein